MKNYFKTFSLRGLTRLNVTPALVVIVFIFSILFSCERQIPHIDQPVAKTATEEYIQQYIQQNPKGIELAESNIKLATTQVHEDGRQLSSIDKNKIRANGSGTGCYPIAEPETIIESQSMMRNSCSQNDWQVYASFIISSENAIVESNPNNINQKTRGRVIVTNTSTGTNVINNNNILPVTITPLGPDPSDISRTRYRVTFDAQSISFSNSIQNWSVRVGLYFYTEFEEESQYPYTVVTTMANLGSLAVCDIVHPVYYAAPQSSMSGFIAGVANCAGCCFSSYPTQQEIQISANASFTDLRHSEVPSNQPPIPTTIGIGDYYTWEPPTGTTRYIKFRNKGSNGCTGPWSSIKTVVIP